MNPIILSVCGSLITICCIAQSPAKVNSNCGCDYLPMCKYTAKEKHGDKFYYGINGSENENIFYNCEKGIITKLWKEYETYLAYVDDDYNPFSGTTTTNYYETEENIFKEIVLNYNLPVGGKWTVGAWQCKIIAKNATYESNGKIYKDVLIVRHTKGAKVTFNDFLKSPVNLEKAANNAFFEGQEVSKAYDEYWSREFGYLGSNKVFSTFRLEVLNNLEALSKKSEEGKIAYGKYLLYYFRGVYGLTTEKDKSDSESNNYETRILIRITPEDQIEFIRVGHVKGSQYISYDSICKGTIDIQKKGDSFVAQIKFNGRPEITGRLSKEENRNHLSIGNLLYKERDDLPFNMAKVSGYETILEMNSRIVTLDKYKKQAVTAYQKKQAEIWEKGTLDSSLYGIWYFRNKPYEFQGETRTLLAFYKFSKNGVFERWTRLVVNNIRDTAFNPERGSWTIINGEVHLVLEPNFINIEYAFKENNTGSNSPSLEDDALKPKLLTFPRKVSNAGIPDITAELTFSKWDKPRAYKKISEQEYNHLK
jgi:hypothetical protein